MGWGWQCLDTPEGLSRQALPRILMVDRGESCGKDQISRHQSMKSETYDGELRDVDDTVMEYRCGILISAPVTVLVAEQL